MNYLSHGFRFLDDPYFVVGTAVPDMLNVIHRRSKVRSKHAEPFCKNSDARISAIASGIQQHHRDDAWFHQTPAFVELNLEFTKKCRDIFSVDSGSRDGLRAGFLGHILVELLLDATLIEEDNQILADYYELFGKVDHELIQKTVNDIATNPVTQLSNFIPVFVREGFLYDYLNDDRLLYRLNNVMSRVKLSPLPKSILAMFPDARMKVRERRDELLNNGSGQNG